MRDETVKGWSRLKRNHQPTQQIPIDVAVVAHFQCILETTTSLCVASICANQWISMTGMIREAHIQRSHLVRETKHAYVFICVDGKNKGKPFPWVLPKETWGKGDGYKSSATMVDALRTSPGDGEPSYLMSQFGPCTTDPFSATTWRAAPMSKHQMGRSREALMRAPPLEFTDASTFCAYASRRFSGARNPHGSFR